uniref:C-type lectin Cal-like n=2 Tax=Gopherus evgoodei TaxID=1825980 RepID=A0A8C4VEW9_9SAUR
MPRARPVSHAGCTWTGLAPEQLPSESLRRSEKMGPVTYFSLCLLCCLIFNPSLAAPSLSAGALAGPCPEGWLSFESNCYGYISQDKTWMQAEVDCQNHLQGSHLASIHNIGETEILSDYIKRHHTEKKPVWIGLSDPHRTLSWKWTDHSLFNYKNWDTNQPDSPGANEHCVVLESPGFQKWHDYPCTDRHAFICKGKPYGRRVAWTRGLPTPGL